MSSLLQFSGNITRKGVELEFYRTDTGDCCGKELDLFTCPKCGRQHPTLGLSVRRPCGMLGCWVVFRYLGKEHVPDLSIPIAVPNWPKYTRVLSPEESAVLWHRE